MMVQPTSLGAYPADPYYDPNRPSWVPYWIDTTTESQAKYAWLLSQGSVTAEQVVRPAAVYTPTPMPPTVKAPTGEVLTTPPASGEEAQAQVDALIAQQMREWQAANAAHMAEVDKKANPANTFWPILILLGIGAIVLLRR